jgi:hypothetical protein
MASRSRSAPLITTLSTVKASPKWSFKGRFDGKMSSQFAPGPGAYGVPTDPKTNRPPSFSFGSTARDGHQGIGNPGPGQYTPFDPNHCTPKFGFGTAGRGGLGTRRSMTPGPGAYDATGGNTGPKFSAAARRNDSSKAPPTPGPGAYKPIFGSANEMPPRWGFGTSARAGMQSLNQTPGPGTYNQESLLSGSCTKPSCPKFSMKPRRNDNLSTVNTPGPGAHGGAFTQFG